MRGPPRVHPEPTAGKKSRVDLAKLTKSKETVLVKSVIGKTFGRLSVREFAYLHKYSNGKSLAKYVCVCQCGKRTVVAAALLRAGKTRSCGCLQRDVSQKTGLANTKHGHNRSRKNGGESPTYSSWAAMMKRCSNPKTRNYELYGGRGIQICARWCSFQNFLADMGERPYAKSLDRIDGNGNYEPANCRWATPKEQRANRRAHGTAKQT